MKTKSQSPGDESRGFFVRLGRKYAEFGPTVAGIQEFINEDEVGPTEARVIGLSTHKYPLCDDYPSDDCSFLVRTYFSDRTPFSFWGRIRGEISTGGTRKSIWKGKM